jgi:hypothetical protein
MPTDTAPRNVCLENARAAIEKKQKPDNKLPSALAKKQKTLPTTLAIPSDKNSIK